MAMSPEYERMMELRDAITSSIDNATCQLEELTAAAETITAEQMYRAVALHAVLTRIRPEQLNGILDEPSQLIAVIEVAYKIGMSMRGRELEELERNLH
jgi:hypothetical protein